jgi:hypothetical protein
MAKGTGSASRMILSSTGLYKAVVKRECLWRGENKERDEGERTYVHHCGILLAALHKFAVVDLGILVLIHTPEYLVHTLASKINACLSNMKRDGPSPVFPRFREA